MRKTETTAVKSASTDRPAPSDAAAEFERVPTIEELAAEQGVTPVTDLAALRGDFWPEEESLDEFLDWVYNEHRRLPVSAEEERGGKAR
jgi:hypothetical protein